MGGAPSVAATAAPATSGSVPSFSVPLLNVGVSRKRKGLGSRHGSVPWALKKRKWIAVDE